MVSEKNKPAYVVYFFLVVPVVVLQGVGCFAQNILYIPNCGDVGFYLECCCYSYSMEQSPDINWDTLEDAVTIQLTTFAASALFMIGYFVYTILLEYDIHILDRYVPASTFATVAVILCISAYSISGVLCLIGCLLIVVAKPEDSTYGPAIYMFLSSGLYIILQCCLYFMYLRDIIKKLLRDKHCNCKETRVHPTSKEQVSEETTSHQDNPAHVSEGTTSHQDNQKKVSEEISSHQENPTHVSQ